MSTDLFGELRTEVRSVGLDHTLSPSDRFEKLSALRGPIVDALGELDRYRSDAQDGREGDAASAVAEVLWLRSNAGIRERLLESGEMSEEALDEIGMLSHDELDRLAEEGLLEEAATSIAQKWAEARKPSAPPQLVPPPRPAPEQTQVPDDQPDPAAERADGAMADNVAAKSQLAERAATPIVQTVVEQEGGQLENLDQRLKSKASIRAKVKRRRDTMPGASDDERAGSISDGARYTAVFPDDAYNQGVERVLGALTQKGFKQQEFQNYWGDPDYAGLLVVLRSPTGQGVELRFHTPESVAAEKASAPIIAKFRTSQDPHERYELWNELAANAAKAPPPKGATELGDTQQNPGDSTDAGSGLPMSGPDSFHSVVPAENLQQGDRAQDPLHGGVLNAHGPAKTVTSVAPNPDEGTTTVGWHDGSASKFKTGSTVKKLRGGS